MIQVVQKLDFSVAVDSEVDDNVGFGVLKLDFMVLSAHLLVCDLEVDGLELLNYFC